MYPSKTCARCAFRPPPLARCRPHSMARTQARGLAPNAQIIGSSGDEAMTHSNTNTRRAVGRPDEQVLRRMPHAGAKGVGHIWRNSASLIEGFLTLRHGAPYAELVEVLLDGGGVEVTRRCALAMPRHRLGELHALVDAMVTASEEVKGSAE